MCHYKDNSIIPSTTVLNKGAGVDKKHKKSLYIRAKK